jgi:hypothetical protein
MDRIIKPEEKINVADIYFRNNVNVVAKVVNEKMIFFKAIPSLAADKKA